MSLNIYKSDVLVVNRNWLVLGTISIKKALTALFSYSNDSGLAAKAFDIDYEQNDDGTWNFDKATVIRPVEIDEWLTLPIRPWDKSIRTPKQNCRVPSVIQACNCTKTHMRKISLSKSAVMKRDGYRCQYTNRVLPRTQLNIDHVISRDEWKRRNLPGNPDNWTNVVTADKTINSQKANKSLSETGLRLIREPKEPLPVAAMSLISSVKHNDWKLFLPK